MSVVITRLYTTDGNRIAAPVEQKLGSYFNVKYSG